VLRDKLCGVPSDESDHIQGQERRSGMNMHFKLIGQEILLDLY
jgi:hypothetical protein